MKISVFCCSPKQETSVTLQAVHYLQNICKEDIFNIQMIGGQTLFSTGHAEAISDADLVIFASPLMQYGLPSQLMYFMENMIIAAKDIAKEKTFTFLTTGNKVLDETTHKYIRHFFADNEIRLLPALSISDSELLTQYGQNELYRWEAYVKTLLFAQSRISLSAPCNVLILDASDGSDNEVNSAISNISSDYISRGASINCINLRNFNILSCTSCEACLTVKKCALVKCDDWDRLTKLIFTNNNIVQVVTSLKHGMPHPSFKAWLDRFHQYGIAPRSNGVIWNYIVSSSASDSDLDCFNEFTSAINCFNRDISTGADRISNFTAHINKAIAAFNTGYAPAETFSAIGMRLILQRQAEEYRNVAPDDYKHYYKNGAYNQIMPNPAFNPIYNADNALSFRQARIVPYQMMNNQIMYPGMYAQPMPGGGMPMYGQPMPGSAPAYNQPAPPPMGGYGQPPYNPPY